MVDDAGSAADDQDGAAGKMTRGDTASHPGILWRIVRFPVRLILLLIGGMVGVILRGVRFIQHPGPVNDGRSDVIRAPAGVLYIGIGVLLAVSAAHPFLPKYEEGSPSYYLLEISRLFVAEMGVALIVAFVIAWGIDAQARRREEQRNEQERKQGLERERRLTQDVFRSVLGIRHSAEYVQKVIETTLDRKIIRRSISMMYALIRLTEEDGRTLDVDAKRFMFLDQAVSFDFENLSSEAQPIDVTFAVPARHGEKLRSVSRVITAKIGDEDQDVEAALQSDGHGDSKIYVWKHRIEGFDTLPVAITTRVIKEDSDSDVWSSYFPCTEGMTLQVNAPPGLHMGIRNNTCSEAVSVIPPNESGMAAWKISGPILPNSGVVFYWRTLEHDGDLPASTGRPDPRVVNLSTTETAAAAPVRHKRWQFW